MTPEEARAVVAKDNQFWRDRGATKDVVSPVLVSELIDLWEAGRDFFYGWAHGEGQEDGVAVLAARFGYQLQALEDVEGVEP